MNLSIFIIPLAVSIGIVIVLTAFPKRSVAGATSLIIFALALVIWAVSYALFKISTPGLGFFWLSFVNLGATVASTAMFVFTLEYTNRGHWLTRRNIFMLFVALILVQVLLWVNLWRGWVSTEVNRQAISQVISHGLWIQALYSDFLAFVSALLLAQTFIHSPLPYRMQSSSILVGAISPIAFSFLGFSGWIELSAADFMLLAFTITALSFTYGLFYYRLLDIIPIARDVVVERMSDGWVMLDTQNRIIDLNPAAEEVLGLPRDSIFGKSADVVLSNWPNIVNRIGDSRELDVRETINMPEGWRYYNLRITPLKNRFDRQMGQLIVFRDITQRKRSEDARQRARDEMFILLNAISGAASRATELEDFLTESVSQIVYAFKSQASALFLLEERNSDSRILSLAAHHEFSQEIFAGISSIPGSIDLVSWMLEHWEPLLIPDVSADSRMPLAMQKSGIQSLLIVPMIIEEKVLGMISLARVEKPGFGSDEIARLTVLADEVAAFIHSDRQRRMAIALRERQRLVRDLHDSVTQKLYGLLTLTEAAQAGLEAGSLDMPAQVLSRIGENARQALKEMRLFLYELQPVDLEREGLISILNQRLAAVEGRADIKARLLADEKICLPLPKEVALYFIAQEALNNVLRHACAKSVTVCLKQKKGNVTLEIEDDGSGFDIKHADNGGMGLRNMRERIEQVNGKLKISSSQGKGTKIMVTVGMDTQPILRKQPERMLQ
jgi:PAS domain S-box-containing protein